VHRERATTWLSSMPPLHVVVAESHRLAALVVHVGGLSRSTRGAPWLGRPPPGALALARRASWSVGNRVGTAGRREDYAAEPLLSRAGARSGGLLDLMEVAWRRNKDAIAGKGGRLWGRRTSGGRAVVGGGGRGAAGVGGRRRLRSDGRRERGSSRGG
jgi:hypothetical protein